MTWTRSDVIRQALEFLGATGNEEPSDEDSDKVDRVVNPVINSLSRRDVYTVSDFGALGPTGGMIEDEAAIELAQCVAYAAANSFGQVGDLARKNEAESNLELLAAPPRIFRNLQIEQSVLPQRRSGRYNGSG